MQTHWIPIVVQLRYAPSVYPNRIWWDPVSLREQPPGAFNAIEVPLGHWGVPIGVPFGIPLD